MARVSSQLVGRDPILADIRGALERALTGRGELPLLTGEAGIGKTALAAEAEFEAVVRTRRRRTPA